MTPSVLRRTALVLGAAFGAMLPPAAARAQKALVYCPVTVDATGCNAIVAALTGPTYPLGVDRGYDGTGGTVDLKAVDLFTYSVFVVPSLADGSTSQPYALLRDAEVAEHLKAALIGRIAMWSGSPDQGATNRGAKDALIQNLAGWAGGAFGAAKGPGLVALLDASASAVSRYDWVRAITPVPVMADPALLIYNGVRALNPRATTILTSGAGPIVYDNMATFGFQVPNGAAGVSLDAVGQTGTAQGGQVVLLTMEAGNAGGALVQTDTDDYPPGTTVVITGSGWEPGETVKLTLHMDPLRDADTELTAVADGNGRFTNTDYAPTQYDVYVRYVLTATGMTSGRRSQTTFTDAPRINTVSVGTQTGTATYGTPAAVSYTVTPLRGGNGTVNGTFTVLSGLPAGVTAGFAPATFTSNGGSALPASTLTLSTTAAALPGVYTFTVRVADGSDLATNTGTLTIGTKTLTGVFTADNKVYDATNSASILTRSLTGVVGADVVSLTGGTATFNDKNAGTGKLVTGTGFSLTGTHASRYTLASSTLTTTANIATKPLAVTGTGTNKMYDGTAAATVTLADNRIAGDVFTATFASATFANENVGAGKTVTVTGIALTGADAANYDANTTCTTSADITPRALVVTVTAGNKVYDGNATATVTIADDRIAGDVFTLTYTTATFNNRNAGVAKPVSVTGIGATGADATNYTIPATANTTADIAPRALAVTAAGVDKIYDGTTAASVTLADDRLSGDVFTATYASATFADKNVGAAKPVSVSGISLSGTDALNYTPNASATTSAAVTVRALLVSAVGTNKIYDATTAATVTLSDNRIAGDVFTAAFSSATFADKNAGTAKPISITGISITGANAVNYNPNTTASASANITAATVVGTFTANDKVYDATTAATIATYALSGDVPSDNASLTGGTATFDTKHVGAGKTVTGNGFTLGGSDAGNYVLQSTTLTATASITARALVVTATGVDRDYDATNVATVTLADNRIAGDAITTAYANATFADKHVGVAKPIAVTGISTTGADAGNYTANTTASASATISAATVSGTITADDKIYDGNASAFIATRSLTGVFAGDVTTLTGGSASFADKNVGNAKPVTATGFTLAGGDATNYVLSPTTIATTASITAKSVTGTFTADNKVYDGTTTAAILTRNVAVTIAGDDVALTGGTASFADKNVGAGKTVSGSGFVLTGTDASNYALASGSLTTTADITPRLVTVTADPQTKVYGTADPALTYQATPGAVVAGDAFTGTLSRVAGETVGGSPYAIVQNGLTLGGNYTITYVGANLVITPATVAGAFTASNKVYDGTAAATILTRTLTSGVVGSDDVVLTAGAATFADKHVAAGKTVTGTGFTLGGSTAGNYVLASATLTTTADITAKTLVIAATGINKVYDATTAATVNLADDRIAGDVFTAAFANATFADKHVGAAKPVSVTGITITGADAGNYSANTSAATTADITVATLTGSFTASNKVYDGNTTASIMTRNVAGKLLTDDVSLDGGTATFADKQVANAKVVTGVGFALIGTDATNYVLASTTLTAAANITPRALTIAAAGVNKVYDGTTAETVTLSDDRVTGDVFTDSYAAAAFNNKNVGVAKPVSVSGISISGADAGNYTFNTTAATTADITQRALAVTATGINKVYDGTTNATVTLADDRVSGDVFAMAYATASFADKHAGAGKTVSVSGISITGTDAGNYTFNATTTATADITQKPLVISATGVNKIYDGTTAATVTLADDRLSGDVFTASYSAASFADKSVGAGKPVSVSGVSISGADAGNYSFNSTAATSADITPRALLIAATGVNKVYDATTAATVTLSDDRVAGDVFTDSYATATFADKNVGMAKPVSVTGISISGVDAGNYTFNTTTSNAADIAARTLAVSATGVNKVYDGDASATVTLADDRVSGDVFTTAYSAASFNDKTVTNGKPVSVTGISITGTDAGNYAANTTAATTADITARALTITAAGIDKVYDGNTAATVTLSDDRVAGDVFTDSYASATFNNENVGTAKPVSVTGIAITGADAANYTFNATASTAADITPRLITITAAAKTKVYGDADPALTYAITVGTLVVPADLSGALTRVAGESVGPYAIQQGSLSLTSNYTLTYVGASLTITPRALSVTADDKSKIAGAVNPPLTGVITGIQFGDNITATYSTTAVTGSLPGAYPITPALVDPTTKLGNYTVTSANGTLTVSANALPVVASITAPLMPVALGTSVSVSAPFTDADPSASNPYTTIIDWGNGTTTTNSAVTTPGVIAGTKVYPVAGVYTIKVTAKQNNFPTTHTDTKTFEYYVVVYDPSGGFVTGGGWINSPAGAYLASPSLTGKANFGFVAKYKKGQTVPDGNTEFQYQAAGLNFKATSFEWLVIAGSRAQFKGSGTINGTGDYGFMLTGTDGTLKGSGSDTFRMKIWIKATGVIVYDNLLGAPDSADPTTMLGGGSIQIHDGK